MDQNKLDVGTPDIEDAAKRDVPLKEELTRDGTVNFHGQPAVRKKVGAGRAVPILYASDCLDTIAWSGAANNMVVYMTTAMHLGDGAATNFVSRWTGVAYFAPFVTAIVADSYLGRFWTALIMLGFFFHGLLLLSLSAALPSLHPQQCAIRNFTCAKASSSNWIFFYVAIYVFGFGGGAVAPIQAFGADQFDENDEKETEQKSAFFNTNYQFIAVGKLVNVLLVFPAQQYLGWGWGFGISTVACLASLLLLSGACATFRYQKPQGNPCKQIAQVFIACIRNYRCKLAVQVDNKASDLEDTLTPGPTYRHANLLRILDKAAVLPPNSTEETTTQAASSWRLCSQSQVDAVKCLLFMLPILGTGIVYKTVNLQLSTLYVLQGQYMDRRLGSFLIPSASINIFEHVSVVLWVLLYDRLFIPIVAKCRGCSRGITNFQRIGIGFGISIISLVVAALVESKRISVGQANGLLDTTSPVPMSVFWNIPQYAIFGASEVFVDVGLNEFFYNQSPIQLRTIGTSFGFIATALGSFLSVLLVDIVNKLTTLNGTNHGWISNNLNQGHLNYFYILLACLSTMNLLCFIYISSTVYSSEESSTLSEAFPSPLKWSSPNTPRTFADKSPFQTTPRYLLNRNGSSNFHSPPFPTLLATSSPLLRSPYRSYR